MLMNMKRMTFRAGFTLVELAVVIVIIGVLAAFAVPRFRKAVERSKAGEAFNYLAAVRSSQERYHSRASYYAENVTDLDINLSTPKYFTVAANATIDNTNDTWSLSLTRIGPAGGYGNYEVVFNQDGYDATTSNINADINPMVQ